MEYTFVRVDWKGKFGYHTHLINAAGNFRSSGRPGGAEVSPRLRRVTIEPKNRNTKLAVVLKLATRTKLGKKPLGIIKRRSRILYKQ